MKFAPIQVSAPDALPITLDEAKAHCRISGDDENDLVAAAIEAATSHLDGYSGVLGRCLMPQVWQQEFDRFQDFPLCLGPVLALESIEYSDKAGAVQSVDLQSVRIARPILSDVVTLRGGASWPDDPDLSAGPVVVSWRAGYADAAAIPAALKHAIKLLVGHFYENREGVTVGATAGQVPFAIDALISPFRKVVP